MSKMRVPKMDVVRFKESDVIVASGAKTMTISNFGDGINLNGIYKFGSFRYTNEEVYNNFGSFKGDFNRYFGADIQDRDEIFFEYGSGSGFGFSYPFSFLNGIEAEDDDAINSFFNGTYSWDGNKFNRQ